MYGTWKLALAALGLSGITTGFVIDVFDTTGCSGPSRSVNVYDNTCADWMGSFKSFKVRVYGGGNQHAYLCEAGGCDKNCKSWWAQGTSPQFQIGSCLNNGGTAWYSAGSFTF